jgi:flagellar protein FlaG
MRSSGVEEAPEGGKPLEVRRIDHVGELAAAAMIAPLTPQQRAEQQQLIHAVAAVNEAQVFGAKSELTFTFDRNTKRPIMKLVDKETQEVIRQFPPEYVLRLAEDARS